MRRPKMRENGQERPETCDATAEYARENGQKLRESCEKTGEDASLEGMKSHYQASVDW